MRVSDNSMNRMGLLLMDQLWQNNSQATNKDSLEDLMSNSANASANAAAIKAASVKPDWDCIPSKDTAMSEEEFEKAIKELALKAAEKGKALGNAGEGRAAFRVEEAALMNKYLSTVAPDRKAAYEKNGSNQDLLTFSNGAWTAKLTPEEISKSAKFYDIYNKTIKEYEAQNGKIPEGTKSYNPYSDLLAEFKAYNFLNTFA